MNDRFKVGSLGFGVRSVTGKPHKRFIPHSAFRVPNWKGMTFIEVIAVMMMIGVLAAVVIPKLGFPSISSTASVDGAAYMIASDIRYVQECAMANRVSKSITFTANQSAYSFPPTIPSISNLDPSGRLPSEITTRETFTVKFNSLGEPIEGGGGSVRVWDGVRTRTISVVNYTGKVNIT